MIGDENEKPPEGYRAESRVLYDGLTNPGQPYVDPAYTPDILSQCQGIVEGVERSKKTREILGPDFTRQVGENQTGIAMTQSLRQKRKVIFNRALRVVGR